MFAQLEQPADRGGHPARSGRDRVEHAPHRHSRREQEPEQTEAGEDHRGADDAGAGRERRRHRRTEQTTGVAQPGRGIDGRAATGEVEQADDGEHHEHDPETDAQWRRRAHLVVLGLVLLVGVQAAGPVAGEQQNREAEARGREDDPAPAQHGGAAVGEKAPHRTGEVGCEPEHREHTDDDEPNSERVGAVSSQLTAGRFATPLPGGRARRSAPSGVATASRGGLATARASRRGHRDSTVTPASPDSAGYPGNSGEGRAEKPGEG